MVNLYTSLSGCLNSYFQSNCQAAFLVITFKSTLVTSVTWVGKLSPVTTFSTELGSLSISKSRAICVRLVTLLIYVFLVWFGPNWLLQCVSHNVLLDAIYNPPYLQKNWLKSVHYQCLSTFTLARHSFMNYSKSASFNWWTIQKSAGVALIHCSPVFGVACLLDHAIKKKGEA